jgi:hypothetical protein
LDDWKESQANGWIEVELQMPTQGSIFAEECSDLTRGYVSPDAISFEWKLHPEKRMATRIRMADVF